MTNHLQAINDLLELVHTEGNAFQSERVPKQVDSLDHFRRVVPFTTKNDLATDRETNTPFGSNLTFPLERYTRYCQTSGTSGQPLPWIDTPESWQSMLDCWKQVHAAAGLSSPSERIFFAFSFGPFLGFWTAYEAATQLGFLAIPGGGMRSEARLQMMKRFEVTALCGTPTYCLRLGSLAQELGLSFPNLKALLVAGEPGGSIPEVRSRLTKLWGDHVRVCDHHGLTETGPVTHQDPDTPGRLIVMEDAFCPEILDPNTDQEVTDGQTGELVLTTLKRTACPLFRYRTGDLVRKLHTNNQLVLDGGILGRIDDMVLVRGVNVYPSAIERVVRRFDDIGEYRVVQSSQDNMVELRLEIEAATASNLSTGLQEALWDQFQLRIPVETVEPGTLPEQEFKAKRWMKT
ncbi:MAG: AMP-binding protein [Verrucomicrobiales bacterium]|jgi:phenylacetate-CoA ligase|nr:AMP-binding protein [Verrucomicrobiales bacterium]